MTAIGTERAVVYDADAPRWLAWAGNGLTLLLVLPLIAAISAGSGYAQWWADARGWSILMDTLAFAGAAACVGTLGGCLLGRAGVGWALAGCVALVVPSSLLGTTWIAALGRNAPLGDWLTVYDWPVAAAVVGLRYVGVAALIVAMHRRGDDRAAKVFTVRRAWWWLRVKPMLRPITAAWLAIVMLASADHVLPSMFLIHTYGTQLLIQYNALLDLPGAAALATPMLGVAVVLLTIAGRVGKPYPATGARGARSRGSVWGAVAVVAVALCVPCVVLIAQVGASKPVIDATVAMREEFIHTGKLAVLSMVICTVLGWCLGEHWLAAWRAGRVTLAPMLLVNLIAPGALLALGVIELFQRQPFSMLRDTDVPLLVAYGCRVTPVTMLIVFAAGVARPTLPITAARVLGVSRWRRWRHVVWPTQRQTWIVAAMVSLLLVATEVEMSVLLQQAGVATVGVRLYTLIHTAPQADVSAGALAVLMVLTPLLIVTGALARERTR